METTTNPSTLTTTAADTLLLTLDEAARQLCCARRSVERPDFFMATHTRHCLAWPLVLKVRRRMRLLIRRFASCTPRFAD